ncbi:hypothetical protein AVEN_37126-1 [Araneus ventricosus]|uniref:Uncharacterized protein n=1 Tax=Araneus ventricosus TaxID=182803 RepID=A0A4Y2FTQ7_ARAVE|nr:hypothetical protein AVEN_37126-1 [Araneus ventricosus]
MIHITILHSTCFNKSTSLVNVTTLLMDHTLHPVHNILPLSKPMEVLKYKVYLGGVPTLKDNISRPVLSIPGNTLRSAVENVVYRMQCVVHTGWPSFLPFKFP